MPALNLLIYRKFSS